MTQRVLDQLIGMLANPESGWHAKVQVLPMLQVLYFLHLPLIEEPLEARVMACLSALLHDAQVEVRQGAAVTLSGLIRCSQRKSINTLLTAFRATLAALPSIKKRQRGSDDEGYAAALLKKHSVILGLSSVVLAFPVGFCLFSV